MLKIKKDELYLITGASGFLGTSLTKRILLQGGKVRALSRNEGNLLNLKQKFPSIQISSGDISDVHVIKKNIIDVAGIFHLAAFKHVGLSEKQPIQCTQSNVIGTLNLLKETENMVLDFIISISSDKAAQVSGVYGATKLLMERLIKEFEEFNQKTQYRVVRYGNVLYSTGSVLTYWKDLLQKGLEVSVTDLNVTRFYWNIEEAVDSIFECMEKSIDSSPYCPKMKGTKLKTLLLAMHKKYGVVELKYKEIGLQPGENIREKVLDKGPYSDEVEQYTIDELMKMI